MSLESHSVTRQQIKIVTKVTTSYLLRFRGGKLMRTHRFVIGVVLGIGLAVAADSIEAKDKSFHASFAGTIINKDDFSFTGTPGSYSTVAGKSTLGPYTAQSVFEASPDGNTCTLPGGGSGVQFVVTGEVFVLSFTEKEEQVFLNLNPSGQPACVDPATGVTLGQLTFDINGGTGRFEGATGTLVKTLKVIGVAPSPPGKGLFSSFTGTFDGTIEFAK
jgi:hypothetical protein